MRAVRWWFITLLFVPLATLPARDVSAQARTPVGYFSVTPQLADPVGAFAGYVGTGWGLNGSFLWPLPHVPWLGLRADLGFVRYGDTSRQVCVVQAPTYVPVGPFSCDIGVDLATSSTIVHGGIGPQLTVPLGPVRAYANGAVQLRYFGASSSLVPTPRMSLAFTAGSGGGEVARERFGQADAAWSAGYGAIFALPIRGARVNIDVGVQRYHDGSVRFLRASDVAVAYYVPPGSPLPVPLPPAGAIDVGGGAYVTLNPPRRSAMDLVVYHIGVRMSVP